ncbi:hypothetical protein COMA2_40092 [Candidatus Nitrospira nitrificans]|uniref:Uncharacterized protein n=1 Tax=Candidatus Nitrospira nitrificans TaxID=1742973 RepID=A0A0S4LMH3_9BACT|nr:hypothetical protein COMA2_40092 [Candidatus Nitrospira nitrificans]
MSTAAACARVGDSTKRAKVKSLFQEFAMNRGRCGKLVPSCHNAESGRFPVSYSPLNTAEKCSRMRSRRDGSTICPKTTNPSVSNFVRFEAALSTNPGKDQAPFIGFLPYNVHNYVIVYAEYPAQYPHLLGHAADALPLFIRLIASSHHAFDCLSYPWHSQYYLLFPGCTS